MGSQSTELSYKSCGSIKARDSMFSIGYRMTKLNPSMKMARIMAHPHFFTCRLAVYTARLSDSRPGASAVRKSICVPPS